MNKFAKFAIVAAACLGVGALVYKKYGPVEVAVKVEKEPEKDSRYIYRKRQDELRKQNGFCSGVDLNKRPVMTEEERKILGAPEGMTREQQQKWLEAYYKKTAAENAMEEAADGLE